MSRVVVIDNEDSFVYTIVLYLRELGASCRVLRSDRVTERAIARERPTHLVISPGPRGPAQAVESVAAIRRWAGEVPILGVCLGHQCLAYAFGGTVGRVEPVHGQAWPVRHREQGLFHALPNPLRVTRYHSLAVVPEALPEVFDVTAWTEDGVIMGIRHKELPAAGVQFHPEAILTEGGHALLRNFLEERG